MPTTPQTSHLALENTAFGLFIGVTAFRDPLYASRPLPHAENDATELARVFSGRLGWNPGNIITSVGPVSKLEVRNGFAEIRARISAAQTCALFVFFISSHGHLYERMHRGKTATLMTSDTMVSDPLLIADTGLTHDSLAAYIDSVRANQKLVIIDACFASSNLGASDIVPTEAYRGLDAAILASSIGLSYAPKDGGPSLFSGCLIRVLEEMEGEVGLGSLFDRVSRGLPANVQQPFLDAKARYIALGVGSGGEGTALRIKFADLLQFTKSRLRLALARYLTDGWDEGRYVNRRDLESAFAHHLESSGKEAFSISGPAGTGKTTSMLYLAQSAISQGHAVLWYSHIELSTSPDPLAVLVDTLRGLHPGLTAKTLDDLLIGSTPLVVFLDAVNEWTTDSHLLAKFCGRLHSLPVNIRAVVSCRDEVWETIGASLHHTRSHANERPEPNCRLGDLDDNELREAMERYPEISVIDPEFARRPLFLRVCSELGAQGSVSAWRNPQGALLERYVDLRFSNVADLCGVAVKRVRDAIARVVHVLCERQTQTLPSVQFFEMTTDRIGSALLEADLVRWSGDGISLAHELLHHFLLSKTLPSDPFMTSGQADLPFSDPWWGAAAFRLLEMRNAERVTAILRHLLCERPYESVAYVLNVLSRFTDLAPYRQLVLDLMDEEDLTGDVLPFATSLFERRGASEFGFVLEILRRMFIGSWDDWRTKKWDDVSTASFATRIERLSARSPAKLLHRCVAAFPAATIRILVCKWLSDETKLRDEEGEVRDVAYAFLLNAGVNHPDALRDAIIALGESPMLDLPEYHIRRVVTRSMAENPGTFLPVLAEWLYMPWLRPLTFTMIAATPESHATELDAAMDCVLTGDRLQARDITRILSAMGAVPGRVILRRLRQQLVFEERQAGIVKGFSSLFTSFPNEVSSIVGELVKVRLLRTDTIDALVAFCVQHACSIPEVAVAMFERAMQDYPRSFGRQIAMGIERCGPDLTITSFVESQLKLESEPIALEHYLYYLRQVRHLTPGDLGWVRRWVGSGGRVYGLMPELARSTMSTNELGQLVVNLEKATGSSYLEESSNSVQSGEQAAALADLAKRLRGSEHLGSLSEESQVWWSLLAEGRNARDTMGVIEKMSIKHFYRLHGQVYRDDRED